MLTAILMAILLGIVLYGVFRASSKAAEKVNVKNLAHFSTVRSEEIAEEITLGRITQAESDQLQKDLLAEEKSQTSVAVFNHRSSPRLVQMILAVFLSIAVLGSVALYQKIGFLREVQFTQKIEQGGLTPLLLKDFLQFRADKYSRAEDWYFVAQDHLSRNEYTQALVAFDTAIEKLPEDVENKVNVLVEYAQTIFYANQGKVTDKMMLIVDQALAIDPNQPTALGLKGVAAFEKQDYRAAILAWQKAVLAGSNVTERSALIEGIQKAREMGGISETEIPTLISHRIRIQLQANSSVYRNDDSVILVYAKVPDRPMPIAIKRIPLSSYDTEIELTNLDNLMPGMTLADAKTVDIVVRVANAADADLTKGKIIGTMTAISSDTKGVLMIPVSF